VRGLVIISFVRPIRIAAWAIIAIAIIRPAMRGSSFYGDANSHAVFVCGAVASGIVRNERVGTSMIRIRHQSKLVLVTDLWISFIRT